MCVDLSTGKYGSTEGSWYIWGSELGLSESGSYNFLVGWGPAQPTKRKAKPMIPNLDQRNMHAFLYIYTGTYRYLYIGMYVHACMYVYIHISVCTYTISILRYMTLQLYREYGAIMPIIVEASTVGQGWFRNFETWCPRVGCRHSQPKTTRVAVLLCVES